MKNVILLNSLFKKTISKFSNFLIVGLLVITIILIGSIASYAQTFDFETAVDGTSIVTQTIGGITLSVSSNSGSSDYMQILNGGGFAGSSGNVVLSDGNSATSMTFNFNTTVDVQYLRNGIEW